MKFIYIVLLSIFLTANVKGQNVYIPDSSFAAFLSTNYPSAMVAPDSLNPNAPVVLSTTILSLWLRGINDFTGISAFVNLDSLICGGSPSNYSLATTIPPLPPNLRSFNCFYTNLISLPSLPNSLHIFSCNHGQLTSLPVLPSNLEIFSCDDNQLTSLPFLPASIKIMYCQGNPLTSLPLLPSSLEYLYCDGNILTSLPALPTYLKEIFCRQNQLTSIPTLPSGLERIYCSDNQLISLPPLPSSLTDLECSGNQLTSLPAFPALLETIQCDHNQLTSLPPLPASLSYIYCGTNQLQTLPSLPSSLEKLSCPFNPITSLPSLPSSLREFNCWSCQLSILPALPDSLQYIYVRFNRLTSLPRLPLSIVGLYCDGNMLTSLPYLPNTLQGLFCDSNSINCLPVLPASLTYLSAPATACIPNLPTWCNNANNTPFCTSLLQCVSASLVKGNIFNDLNQNGIKDSAEAGLSNMRIFSSTGYYGTPSDSNGNYFLMADTGISFTVVPSVPRYRRITTTSNTHYFTSYGLTDSLENIGLYDTLNINDLELSEANFGVVRPFSYYHTKLRCRNAGTTTQNGYVYLIKDSIVNFISSVPSVTSISGDTLFYNFTSLFPLHHFDIDIIFQVAVNVTPNTWLEPYAEAVGAPNDSTPDNNYVGFSLNVLNSFDPNEKTVEPTIISHVQLANRDKITYTVYFQNTGTAPAIDIAIKDTLSPFLDLATFKMENESHNISSWNIVNRVLIVEFNNINLPDSNANEPASHGFFKYSVKPVATLQAGDQIDNTAYIYFDFNNPVVTNTTHTSVFTSVQIASSLSNDKLNIYPNPANENITISSLLNGRIIITNILGQIVYSSNKQAPETSIKLGIPVGIYFIKLETKEGSVVRKLVKSSEP